jgi:hypothetical protein
MPRYECEECDFTTKYMVQFKKHLDTNHNDNDNETENIKLNTNTNNNDNNEIEKLKLQMELLKLQLKMEMLNEGKEQKKEEKQKLKKKLKPSLYLDEFIDVIPIPTFKGNIFTNDFLGLREMIDNTHRNMVVNQSFSSCVLNILEEVREKYGGKEYFPIACVDSRRQKLFFNFENKGWVEDNAHFGFLHNVICRIGHIMCYFDDDNEDDVRWKRNKENHITLINRCFAWDNLQSGVFCRKKLIASCCKLLNINDFIKEHSSSSDSD